MQEHEVERLQQKLEADINKYKADVSIEEQEDAKIYKLVTKDAKLTVTLGLHWIGYELEVDESVLGKKISAAVDTDNYPLDREHRSTAIQILSEVDECLNGFLQGRVYVGMQNEQPILAIPDSPTSYQVKRFKMKEKWWQLLESSTTESMSEDELKSIKDIRSLSYK